MNILGKLPKTFGGESRSRSNQFQMTKLASPTGAEWEVYYGNSWRDVSDDFRWDVTQEGNTILRAIRWDSGEFRSYREDRGLILRKKGSDDDEKKAQQQIDYGSFLTSAGQSFGISLAAGTLLQLVPQLKPAFVIAGVVGFAFKSVEIVQAVAEGQLPANILLSTAGSILGSSAGGAAVKGLFGEGKLISKVGEMMTPKKEPTYTGLTKEHIMKNRYDLITVINTQAQYSVRGTSETGKNELDMPVKVAANVKRMAKALRNLSILGEGD